MPHANSAPTPNSPTNAFEHVCVPFVSNSNRLKFVRMEMIRNEKLFTKFKAAVCNMERRTSANPAVSVEHFHRPTPRAMSSLGAPLVCARA